MDTILLLVDDAQLRSTLEIAIETTGARAFTCSSADVASRAAVETAPIATVVDLRAGPDVLAFVRGLRSWSEMPVLVVSLRGHQTDVVAALEAGADDYVRRPVSDLELAARVRAAARRGRLGCCRRAPVVTAGPFVIDRARREVTVSGAVVHLTPTEFRILALLAEHPGEVMEHRRILGQVFGEIGGTHQTHHLRVHIASLRRKVEADPQWPRWIETVAGVGYRFREQ